MQDQTQVIEKQEVRNSIKKFVREFNDFVRKNDRAPRRKYEAENSLAIKWSVVKNGNTLSLDEKNYIQQYLIKLDNIRPTIKQFVQEYLVFIKENKRKPKIVAGGTEASLFRKFARYAKAQNLNAEEIDFLKQHNIDIIYEQTGNIRTVVKRFVKEYNDFIEEYHRDPLLNKDNDRENKIYMKYLRYTNCRNPLNLNDEEKKYINDNLSKVEIRLAVRRFIQDFTDFIKTNKREPKGNLKDDKNLYLRWKKYINSTDLNEHEIKFLEDNGIFIKTSSNQGISLLIRLFVDEYNQFIKDNGREPSYKSQNKEEIGLYLRIIKLKESKHLNEAEILYLNQNGIEINQITRSIS